MQDVGQTDTAHHRLNIRCFYITVQLFHAHEGADPSVWGFLGVRFGSSELEVYRPGDGAIVAAGRA